MSYLEVDPKCEERSLWRRTTGWLLKLLPVR